MESLRQSISAHGVIQRLIVRPLGEEQYQIISGRHRRAGARLAGYSTVPCEIRQLDDTEAQIQMIETNLQQREKLLPSERAFAYKMRLEALKQQASMAGGHGVQTPREHIATAEDISGRQVQRYLALANLTPELLELVDIRKLTLRIGVALSMLSTESQASVHKFFLIQHHHPISEQLVSTLRELERKGPLTDNILESFLSPGLKPPRKVSIPYKQVNKYFPIGTSAQQMQKTILLALSAYYKERG